MPAASKLVLNVASYRFVPLADPATWVGMLNGRAVDAGLKGTIVLASEGINFSLAGLGADVERFVRWLANEPRFVDVHGEPAFAQLAIKRSWSVRQPFGRLRVRHRSEIVTMRRPAIRPDSRRAPAIAPERLAEWLARGHDDDGHSLVLLDARNAFEVEHGTFDGARQLHLSRFDEFPDAVDALRDELGDRTVVTFCTGGIRCEKAALYMADHGYARIHQLDGGILGYFARVGDSYWTGSCFVFDERIALHSNLGSDLHGVSPDLAQPKPVVAAA